MDLPSSLKKSLKSRGTSAKVAAEDDANLEHRPILYGITADSSMAVGERREVIVKIDGGDGRNSGVGIMKSPQIWPENGYEFWRKQEEVGEGFRFREDPPSKLIGDFLDRQRATGETSLDLDFEMEELPDDRGGGRRSSPRRPESPLQVSFQTPTNDLIDVGPEMRYESCSSSQAGEEEGRFQSRLRSSNLVSQAVDNGGGEVLKCSSFQIRQSMTKTKSRLIDPPDPDPRIIRASGQLKSGMIGRASDPLLSKAVPDEEEDDPFRIEDIPEGLKENKLSLLTVLQWVSLILIVGSLICTLAFPKWRGRSFRGLAWWKWEVLVLVLICGRLVSGWGMRIVVFFIERNFLLRKRVLYFVYGVRKPVQNCIWLGLVLLAWHFLFDERVDQKVNSKFLDSVSNILVCFLVGTVLWLVKTLMVKVLASSFHVSTFFDRIQESVFNQYVIETLSGPPLVEIKFIKEEEERTMAEVQKLQNAGATMPPDLKANAFPSSRRSGRVIGGSGVLLPPKPQKTFSDKLSGAPSEKEQDKGIPIDHLHKMNPKNISAWNMKRLIRIVKHGVLSTLDEQILGATNGDESSTLIKSELEAKRAARKIFQNVARRGFKFIYLDDLMRFMRYDEALKTMTLICGSPDRDKISKSVLKNWVVNAFRERRALALSLNDTKTAVDKLHHIVNVLISIIIAVVCSLILGLATSKFLLFLSSQIVVVAFIFGNTCKTVFEAVVFVFVMHPFDVGDRCEIDGIQMVVEEMNILTTIFLRYDNQKIQYPNSTLATKPISNYYRSPDMGDAVDFHIHVATPPEKVALMKQRIISFVESKKDHWYAEPAVVVMDLAGLNKIKMALWLRHRMNHQDMGERYMRRAVLIDEMVRIFNDLDIEYRLHPIDINIRTMPPPHPRRMTLNTTNSHGGGGGGGVPSNWETL